jgi:ketosteroid isomerase-like protein
MRISRKQVNEGHFDALVDSGLLSGTSMSLRNQARAALKLTGIITFALLCIGYAHSQRPHKVHHPKRVEREEVQQIEGQWRQAMLTDDVAAMDKLLADDYLGVTATGDMVTKMQQLDRMRNRQIMFTKLDMTDVKFKLVGQIAIVTALSQIEAVVDGRTIDGAFRNTRIYQRLSTGVWKITNFETTRVLPGVRSVQTASSGSGKS